MEGSQQSPGPVPPAELPGLPPVRLSRADPAETPQSQQAQSAEESLHPLAPTDHQGALDTPKEVRQDRGAAWPRPQEGNSYTELAEWLLSEMTQQSHDSHMTAELSEGPEGVLFQSHDPSAVTMSNLTQSCVFIFVCLCVTCHVTSSSASRSASPPSSTSTSCARGRLLDRRLAKGTGR